MWNNHQPIDFTVVDCETRHLLSICGAYLMCVRECVGDVYVSASIDKTIIIHLLLEKMKQREKKWTTNNDVPGKGDCTTRQQFIREYNKDILYQSKYCTISIVLYAVE